MYYSYWISKDDMASDADRTKLKTLLIRTYIIVSFSVGLFAYPLLQEHYLVLIAFASSSLFVIFEKHRTVTVSSAGTIVDFVIIALMILLIQWCIREPYLYDGQMYNRKWCGIASWTDHRCNVYKD